MLATTIATVLATAPSTVKCVHQKNWMQVRGPGGAGLYIQKPGKTGNVRLVNISDWGYAGLPAELALPAGAAKPIDDNGAVSLQVDLDKAPEGWLAKALAHLAVAQAEPDPRRDGRRGKRSSGTAPDMAALIAQARQQAQAAASSHVTSDEPDAQSDAGSDAPIGDDFADSSDDGEVEGTDVE